MTSAEFAPTAIPLPYSHLYDIVPARSQEWPDAVAFGSQSGLGWKTITGKDMDELTGVLAAELVAEGIREGDRVVLWVPSSWQTPIYFFALWRIGAIVVPFDREMNPEAGAAICRSVEPRLVIVGHDEIPAWGEGQPITPWWEPGSRGGKATAWERPHEELAAIFFTSGTTGSPKGCMISHTNLLSQLAVLGEHIPLDTSCRLASILPLSHLFELTCGFLYPYASGSAIHYIPSRRAPDILRVFTEQHITHMVAVPQLLTLMGTAMEGKLRDKLGKVADGMFVLSGRLPFGARRKIFAPVHKTLGGNLQMIASGGAALPVEVQILWERLGVRIVQGYGASETSPVIAAGNANGTPPGAVGTVVRGMDVRFGEGGELIVRGPNVMQGYWKDPAKTAEVLEDGWYATGDIATIDDGLLRLNGRAKDLIVLPSGLKVWPTDVEDVLASDPAVKDAVVLMTTNATGGATLHAYLVPEASKIDIQPILTAANARLAVHQKVATASWWPEPDFPRTSTLKVKRNLLPTPNLDAAPVPAVEVVFAPDDPVVQAIAAAANRKSVTATQTLAELGFDSLAITQLALAIEEKTGKAVNDGDLTAAMTVAEAQKAVAGVALVSVIDDKGRVLARESVPPVPSPWPYTAGRSLRWLGFPFDLFYRYAVTETLIKGREHLANLPETVIFAGTHHSFADVPVVRHALSKSPAKKLVSRLLVPAAAVGWDDAGAFANYASLAFGLYPLRQFSQQEESLRGLVNLAKKGNSILIFPQGNHVEPQQEIDGEDIARFKLGTSRIAEALQAPVIPFGLAGTERLIPADSHSHEGMKIAGIPVKVERGPLAIAFGAPLQVEPGESAQTFTARLQEVCFALTREAEAAINSR